MPRSILTFSVVNLIILLQCGCSAQFGGLPRCAEEAGLMALEATGCHIPDFQCICSNTTYIDSLEPAFEADCNPTDVISALRFASRLCIEEVDITITFAMETSGLPLASTIWTTTSQTISANRTSTVESAVPQPSWGAPRMTLGPSLTTSTGFWTPSTALRVTSTTPSFTHPAPSLSSIASTNSSIISTFTQQVTTSTTTNGSATPALFTGDAVPFIHFSYTLLLGVIFAPLFC